MSELFDEPEPGANAPEFSVSEISGAVKRTIEGAFSRVRVRGEVGRVMHARSGHFYFDLKDDRAVIASVAWKGVAARLRQLPEEGMEVVATGKISTFGGQSKYQLIVDDVAPAGLGALMVMLEKRRKMFEAEGLFAADRKRPIPYLPRTIGVVTSPGGAVIRDILHRLRDRFPTPVYLWPVVVQGDKCAVEVANAIRGFDALGADGPLPRPDVLIIARGGGSIEDLWGFNEEIVVRAAADCSIPIISAVGHETDTTLIDHVADRRAPTPTAAAEMAVPVRMDLLGAVAAYEERRVRSLARIFAERKQRLADLSRALPKPAALVSEQAQSRDQWAERLPRGLIGLAQRRRLELSQSSGGFGPALLSGYLRDHRRGLNREAGRLMPALQRRVARLRDQLAQRRLSAGAIGRALLTDRRAFNTISSQFTPLLPMQVARLKEALAGLDRMRASLGHEETLKRGFAVVRAADGRVLPDRTAAQSEASLHIQFRDGQLRLDDVAPATATEPAKKNQKNTPTRAASKPSKNDNDGGQGSLF